jgi:hypothetical protein
MPSLLETPGTSALTGALDRRAFWQIAEGPEGTEASEGPVARAMNQELAWVVLAALVDSVVTTPPAEMAVTAGRAAPLVLAALLLPGVTVAPAAWVDSVAVTVAPVVTAGGAAPVGLVGMAGLEATAAPGESAVTALPHGSQLSGVAAQRSVHHHRAVVAWAELLSTALPARVLHRRLRQRTLKHRTSASTQSQMRAPRTWVTSARAVD